MAVAPDAKILRYECVTRTANESIGRHSIGGDILRLSRGTSRHVDWPLTAVLRVQASLLGLAAPRNKSATGL